MHDFLTCAVSDQVPIRPARFDNVRLHYKVSIPQSIANDCVGPIVSVQHPTRKRPFPVHSLPASPVAELPVEVLCLPFRNCLYSDPLKDRDRVATHRSLAAGQGRQCSISCRSRYRKQSKKKPADAGFYYRLRWGQNQSCFSLIPYFLLISS